jgi:hypothetical protein
MNGNFTDVSEGNATSVFRSMQFSNFVDHEDRGCKGPETVNNLQSDRRSYARRPESSVRTSNLTQKFLTNFGAPPPRQ